MFHDWSIKVNLVINNLKHNRVEPGRGVKPDKDVTLRGKHSPAGIKLSRSQTDNSTAAAVAQKRHLRQAQ
jgi:hypothetical protein